MQIGKFDFFEVKMNKIVIGILALGFPLFVIANCWFGCDSLHRDINTDTAKVEEELTRGYTVRENNGYKIFRSKHSNAKALLKKDISNKILSIRIKNDIAKASYISSILNFGVINGLVSLGDITISEDKRCIRKSSSYGEDDIIICDYRNNTNLPISNSLITEKRNELSF